MLMKIDFRLSYFKFRFLTTVRHKTSLREFPYVTKLLKRIDITALTIVLVLSERFGLM